MLASLGLRLRQHYQL